MVVLPLPAFPLNWAISVVCLPAFAIGRADIPFLILTSVEAGGIITGCFGFDVVYHIYRGRPEKSGMRKFMHLYSGRARTFETAVSVLILLIMIGTAVGIYIISRDYNMARFGIASEQEQQGDFPPVGRAETYNYDNLYEKIDGKAPMYQEAGFVGLTAQRFAAKSNPELGFELYIYDMNNAKNAFSVYSRQKRADGIDLSDLGASAFGYVAGNAICISLGKNYIEMIGSAESNELVDGMKGIAKNMAAQFKPGEKDKMAELGYFPAACGEQGRTEGTVAGTWKLQIDNAFGFDGLTDTYSAQYKVADKSITIFLSRRKNADEAKKVAKNYYDFLITNGAKALTVDSEILKSAGASVVDFYGAFEIVFSTGTFVGGVHEANDKQAAQKAAEVLMSRLKEIND
jgi:hypothetical protein